MSISRRSHDIFAKALADRQAADEIVASVRAGSASGTVTSVSVVSANGVSGSVATATTTPAITLALGAITPTTIVASGAVSGSNLSGTNTGNQTIALTGDVTGTGTGSFAATIASAAVSYAKLQNEAAHSLLGNPTGSAAAPSEITLGSGLSFSGTTLVASGSSLPSGTAGQTLLTDGASPAFSSIVEVYTATSPNATGVGSTALNLLSTASGTNSHADSAGTASGDESHADSAGTASGDDSHADSSGTASGPSSHADSDGESHALTSHADSAGIAYGAQSHAETGSKTYGDNCHSEGIESYAGPLAYDCTLTTVSGKTHATITGVDVRSQFNLFGSDTVYLLTANVFGAIQSAAFTGGDTVLTLSTVVAPPGADSILEPDSVRSAHAEGHFSKAIADTAHAQGTSGYADLIGKHAQGGGSFSVLGDCQGPTFLTLSQGTFDDTPTILTILGCQSGTGLPLIRANTTYGFTATIVGRSSSAADDVLFVRHGLIRDTAGTVALAGSVTTVGTDAGTGGGLAWSAAITADNTNKALQVAVTGAAATNIHWVCKLECVEVG